MAGKKRKKVTKYTKAKRLRMFIVVENAETDSLSTKFTSLNDNCLEEIFEWLCLEDLTNLSTTCRRMQDVVGDYFGRKYPTKRMTIKMDKQQRIEFWPREKYVQRFREYFQNIAIRGRQPALFRHVGAMCYKTPKKIRILEATALTEIHAKCIEGLLQNVEIIEFQDCSFATEFYDCFLKYCKNLKQLVLKTFTECTHKGVKNRWLLEKYPKLVHLNWSFDAQPPPELNTFFHRNPNVQSFAASRFPLDIIKLITNASIKFDELCLDVGFGVDLNMKHIFHSIENLHSLGLFKKFQMIPTTSMFVGEKFPPMHYLEGIMANQVFDDVIGEMLSLKVLHLDAILFRPEAEVLANKLVNLEEIYAYTDTVEAIVPFVCLSPKLRKVYVNKAFVPNCKQIQIAKLSKERAKLKNNDGSSATPVSIYLKEELFMSIKWTVDDLKQGLIQIKRAESHFVHNTLVRM